MLLLDTCTLLWLGADQSKLSGQAKNLISHHAGSIFVSSIVGFEIARKCAKGCLSLSKLPQEWLSKALELHGIREIPVTWKIAIHSAQLPPLHADPCDRILVATAELQGMTIVSPDTLIKVYPGIRVEW